MGRWIIVVTAVLLAGCASSQPTQKLSRADHENYANSFVGLERCIQQGDISPELGALGKRYLSSQMDNYVYYVNAFQMWVDKSRNEIREVSPAHCNETASLIAGRKQQIDIHNASVDQGRQELQNTINQINNNRPVLCNTVGTYTMCQ